MRCNQTYNGLLQVHLWTHESALVHSESTLSLEAKDADRLRRERQRQHARRNRLRRLGH